jgi:hypothetical protein
MRTLWRGIVRTVFWSYERRSWPYDVMVIVIVLFVFLPRQWFHDQPQSAAVQSSAVQIISEDSANLTSTYRLEADILPVEKRSTTATPELERETHDILGRTVEELKGHTFQVRRIDPIFAEDGTVLYYEVTVHP